MRGNYGAKGRASERLAGVLVASWNSWAIWKEHADYCTAVPPQWLAAPEISPRTTMRSR
jgi:hypothetical protein